MRLDRAKIDAGRLDAGELIDNIPGMEDLHLRVRGYTSPTYRRVQGEILEKATRAKDGEDFTWREREDLAGRVLVRACLIGWSNLIGDDGQPIPFDADLAEQWVLNDDFRPFRMALEWAASEATRRAAREQDDARKN